MAVDYRLIIKELQGLDNFYAAFAQTTRMPFVECDEETFDDQVYLFEEEEEAKSWVKEHNERQIPVIAVKIGKDQMLMFYTSLYLIGVNRLVFHNGAGFAYIPIEQVVTVKKPDASDKGLPRENATLQLTMIYFLQELRRPGQKGDDVERGKKLQEMEQEMMMNLIRSRYIVVVDISKVEGEFDPKKQRQNIQIPYLKNQQGEIMQLLFSDMWEFQKFSKNHASKLGLSVVPFKGLLPSLMKEARGFVLNPAGVNLAILREKLEMMTRQAQALDAEAEEE